MPSIVILKTPIKGVASTTFLFYNVNEAYEFQSCISSQFPDVDTELHENVGEATEVFPDWSF